MNNIGFLYQRMLTYVVARVGNGHSEQILFREAIVKKNN